MYAPVIKFIASLASSRRTLHDSQSFLILELEIQAKTLRWDVTFTAQETGDERCVGALVCGPGIDDQHRYR